MASLAWARLILGEKNNFVLLYCPIMLDFLLAKKSTSIHFLLTTVMGDILVGMS